MARSVIQSVGIRRERLLELHAAWPERFPALFESVAHGGALGRYDILFAYPQAVLWRDEAGQLHGRTMAADSFLDALDEWWSSERIDPGSSVAQPFTGGWLLFLGYETASEIEPTLALPRSPQSITALAIRIRAAIIFDHHEQQAYVVAEQQSLLDQLSNEATSSFSLSTNLGISSGQSSSDGTVFGTVGDRTSPSEPTGTYSRRSRKPSHQTSSALDALCIEEAPSALFLDSVKKAQAHISAGDVYQVNLSRLWRTQLPEGTTPANIYRRLRNSNPAPFAASLTWQDLAILSSSPERLFEIRNGEISTRPIAGTRPRSRQAGADADETSKLIAHPKERAEHIMLIDLERNDLGRVCVPGSVRVDEFMVLESYAHVHHIVSNVRGRLRENVTPGAVLRAVFPGGTITGCPKVRCMQIIAELEGTGRGAYTGTLGYLNRDGSGDFNILIRTLVVQGRELTFRAGGGIVADSDPERELEETRAKAKGLLRALQS